jgi:hypothetical protein
MGRIQRRIEKVADKHVTVYIYSSDGVAVPSILIGPKYVVAVVNSEVEVNDYISRILELSATCMRCGRHNDYFRVEIRPDSVGAVCGNCDPVIKFAVKYFELIDLILPF